MYWGSEVVTSSNILYFLINKSSCNRTQYIWEVLDQSVLQGKEKILKNASRKMKDLLMRLPILPLQYVTDRTKKIKINREQMFSFSSKRLQRGSSQIPPTARKQQKATATATEQLPSSCFSKWLCTSPTFAVIPSFHCNIYSAIYRSTNKSHPCFIVLFT